MRALFLALLLLFAAPLAAEPTLPPAALADTPLPDAAQEAKAQALMHELRCLVCQNQSIADSHADMAGDMRAPVRERIAAQSRRHARAVAGTAAVPWGGLAAGAATVPATRHGE